MWNKILSTLNYICIECSHLNGFSFSWRAFTVSFYNFDRIWKSNFLLCRNWCSWLKDLRLITIRVSLHLNLNIVQLDFGWIRNRGSMRILIVIFHSLLNLIVCFFFAEEPWIIKFLLFRLNLSSGGGRVLILFLAEYTEFYIFSRWTSLYIEVYSLQSD